MKTQGRKKLRFLQVNIHNFSAGNDEFLIFPSNFEIGIIVIEEFYIVQNIVVGLRNVKFAFFEPPFELKIRTYIVEGNILIYMFYTLSLETRVHLYNMLRLNL